MAVERSVVLSGIGEGGLPLGCEKSRASECAKAVNEA